MVNLIRYQLSNRLGYKYTLRIPMQMHNKTEIYDMVFATDHFVGDKIMKHLYNAAAQREPGMMAQARQLSRFERIERSGQPALFEAEIVEPPVSGETLWRPEPCWDPACRDWW